MAERFRDLTESVRQKNQHITQLLNDIEVMINLTYQFILITSALMFKQVMSI